MLLVYFDFAFLLGSVSCVIVVLQLGVVAAAMPAF